MKHFVRTLGCIQKYVLFVINGEFIEKLEEANVQVRFLCDALHQVPFYVILYKKYLFM